MSKSIPLKVFILKNFAYIVPIASNSEKKFKLLNKYSKIRL